MSKIVTTRLNDDEILDLNEIAQQESLDRAVLIRKMLLQQIKQYRMHTMGELYRKGVLSL